MNTMTHTLKSRGAAYVLGDNGWELLDPNNGTAGNGHAMCSCGWRSEPLPSGKKRVQAHRDHKLEVELEAKREELSLLHEEETAEPVVEQSLPHEEETEEPVEEQKFDRVFGDGFGASSTRWEAWLETFRTGTSEFRNVAMSVAVSAIVKLKTATLEQGFNGKVDTHFLDLPGNYAYTNSSILGRCLSLLGVHVLDQPTGTVSLRCIFVGEAENIQAYRRFATLIVTFCEEELKVWQRRVRDWELRKGQTDMVKFVQNRAFLVRYGYGVADVLSDRLDEHMNSLSHEQLKRYLAHLDQIEESLKQFVEETYPDADKSQRRGGRVRYARHQDKAALALADDLPEIG